jgi:calcyclin binding protein
MVDIDEIMEDGGPSEGAESVPPSQERLLDADDLERLLPQVGRPTARMQLEALVKKMRREAASLKAMEGSKASSTSGPPPSSEPVPVPVPNAPPVTAPSAMYVNVDTFAFDAGGYNEKFVTLYLPLPGVGDMPRDRINVTFGKDSFDVTVLNLTGKNYRLKKDNLEHDIVPDKSKFIVKADKIIVKLQKVKGEYGSYDYWSKLTDPKRKDKKNKDPAASITDMMKEMYENGDDNMKKMIGETMMKQRNGELNGKKDAGMGGMGGVGDFDDL